MGSNTAASAQGRQLRHERWAEHAQVSRRADSAADAQDVPGPVQVGSMAHTRPHACTLRNGPDVHGCATAPAGSRAHAGAAPDLCCDTGHGSDSQILAQGGAAAGRAPKRPSTCDSADSA